jgi:hypothetical protein
VLAAVRQHGRPRVDDPVRLAGVDTLGMDETAFQAANASRATSFVTGIVDLTPGSGPARLLDVVAGRSASALVSWISERDSVWRGPGRVARLYRLSPRDLAPDLEQQSPGTIEQRNPALAEPGSPPRTCG